MYIKIILIENFVCLKRCLRSKKDCLSGNFAVGIACAAGGISVGVLHSFGDGAARRENIHVNYK